MVIERAGYSVQKGTQFRRMWWIFLRCHILPCNAAFGEREKMQTPNQPKKKMQYEKSYPSPPWTGSLISRRKSAWCSWISLTSWGFCFPNSWSMGCKMMIVKRMFHWRNIISDGGEWTCNNCGFACTIARKTWNCNGIRKKQQVRQVYLNINQSFAHTQKDASMLAQKWEHTRG